MTPGSRYVQLLQAQPNTNNGTVTGGLAHMLQQYMMGSQMGADQRRSDQQDAAYSQRLSEALRLGMGTPGRTINWNQPTRFDGTGGPQTVIPDKPGDMNAMMQYLAGDASTAPLAFEMFANQPQAQQSDPWALYDIPSGYGPVDPADPTKGVQPLPGFTPDQDAPTIRDFNVGDQIITRQLNADGTWTDLSTAPRWQPQQPSGPSQPTPYTDLAKAASDLRAGLITQEQYDALASPAPATPDPSAAFGDENTLRDEYLKFAQPYIEVRDALKKVEQAAANPNAASDISLVFAYMKMIDPGSTVREGEAATIENARGVPATILNLYNQAVEGTMLAPEQRAQFLAQAQGMFSGYQASHDQLVQQYSGLAQAYGLDPSRVVIDFSYTPQPTPPGTDGAAQFGDHLNNLQSGDGWGDVTVVR